MRLLIAMMKHETNTFSPVPTPLARFGHGPGPLYGDAAIRAYRGTGSGLGAYLDLAEREGAEVVLPIAAGAPPSRPVEDAAFEHIAGMICDAVKQGGYDGMFLDLHGAMVTESYEDGEGELLRRIRAIDPVTPIAVSLDMPQPLRRDHRQRDRRHRLPHLPAYRHLRHRQARRRDPAQGDARQGEARHRLGQCADAAACDAAGLGRSPEPGIAGPRCRDDRSRRIGGEPVHRFSACRHRQCRPQRRRGDRR